MGTPAWEQECGNDEGEGGETGAEEFGRGRDEAIAPEGDGSADGASGEEEEGNDGEAEAAEPGLLGAGGDEGFNEGDGDGDAPEGVEVEHEEGPPGTDVEGRNEGVIEKMHVQPEVVGIEEGLGGEAFFDECVGCAEEEDAGPSAAGAADGFADEEGTAAVHGSECNECRQHFDG